MITVGRVVRPHGNRGEVVVAPETDFAGERFRQGATLHAWRDGQVTPLAVTGGRAHQGRWIVGFDGVASIDAAEALRGLELKIPPESVRAPESGSFLVHDLVGCRVTTMDGRLVGVVEHVQLDAGTPLLGVRSARGEVLVPLAEEICREVDVARKSIVIAAPEGLLDLNR
jgi:16S rRNA processing protein RimM